MIKYRIQFTNQIQEDYVVYLNKKSYSGDFIDLIGTGEVLTASSINNDDDRFSPIISKEIVIGLWIPPTQNVSIENFIATEDDEWQVTLHREKEAPPIFQGFLVVEDSSQPLYDRPYPLTLRASDGIPLLKNVALVKSDGSDFDGDNNITDYIGHILYYINPDIPFRVYYDIYHTAMNVNNCSLEQIQLYALTFEQNETTFMNSYAVLEMLMKDLGCRLMYENGYWHIVGIEQYLKSTGFSWHEYKIVNHQVTHQDSNSNEILIGKIGKHEVIQAINKDAIIYYKVASKSVQETFTYKIPKEIVCNQQLLRGDKIDSIAGPVTYNTNGTVKDYGYQGYELECWTHHRNGGLAGTGIPPTNLSYIRREFDEFNVEKDRYIVLPTEANNAGSTQLRTSQFFVGAGDKLNISAESRVKKGYGGRQTAIWMYILLRGDNGKNYNWGSFGSDPTPIWHQTSTDFNSGFTQVPHLFEPTDDKGDWNTFSVETGKMPTSGTVQLVFFEWSLANYPNETHYKNIRIEYLPYIKNSYLPVDGDYNIYSQDLKINRTIEETVSISDSDKRIIRGSLLVNNLLAAPSWFRLGKTETLRFRQIQTLIKYNFHFRQFRKVEGTLKGLSLFNATDENIPFGFLPQYLLSDIPNSPKYILTAITDCDYLQGQWRGVIVEIPTEVPTFDTYDFQYIFK